MVAPVTQTHVSTSPAPVEKQLDELIDRLSQTESAPATRALLIEARRLRSIVANWRTVPPHPATRDEMMARVLHIAAAVAETHAPAPRTAARRTPSGSSTPAQRFRSDEPPPPSGDVHQPSETTVIAEAFTALPQTPLDVHPVQLEERLPAHLAMLVDPHSARADAYRALRHRLANSGDPKVIAVTSALPREGKTTAAINLAVSLREGARGRVLLLEANLRAPAISQMLGFLPPVCIGEQFIRHRKDPLEPWIAAEPLAPLHVMAVHPQRQHSPLLDPIGFSIAIDRLRLAGYDYIVVDTSSILESADLNMIADSVDGLILTALARKSDTKAIKRAINQLGSLSFVGTVLLE